MIYKISFATFKNEIEQYNNIKSPLSGIGLIAAAAVVV
jgi:hypothetical protein